MKNNWMLIALIGGGLVVFGWIIRHNQQAKKPFVHRGPLSVAAVRGGSEPIAASGDAANVAVDYVKGLQDDVSTAQRAADKYEKAAKARNAEAHAADAANE